MTTPTAGGMIDILLVEDNDGDARLATEAMRDSKVRNTFHRVTNGEEALAFLRGEGPYSRAPRPDLILLDLNLPRMDGRQVLQAIKQDESLKRIPVVILTASSDEQDILEAYDMHANCYITKPIDFVQFLKVVRSVENFWLTVVKLPDGT